MNPFSYARGLSVAGRLDDIGEIFCVHRTRTRSNSRPGFRSSSLVLYTPEARQGAGGISAITNKSSSAVLGEANSIFSKQSPTSAASGFLVAGSIFRNPDIRRGFQSIMDPNDRYLNLRSLRAAAKADLVCLVIETFSGGFFTARKVPPSPNAFQRYSPAIPH